MVKKAKPYSNWVKVKGVLKDMDKNLRQEIVEMCQEKAREDLKQIGGDESNLLWKYEQKYIGVINGHKVTATKPFEGAEPWTFIRWKASVAV